MPVCKRCHNYVTGKLEKGKPCPHCGNEDTLNDKQEGEYRSIFSSEIDTSYNQPSYNTNNYGSQPTQNYNSNYASPPPQNQQLKLYNDLPLEFLFPFGVSKSALPVTEQKIYLQLSLEFLIIINKSKDYQEGMRNWYTVLPERLNEYGIMREVWDRISYAGDRDQRLQDELKKLMVKIF